MDLIRGNNFEGDVNVSGGNVVVDSGQGIDFSAAGGGVLDHWEQGTWTPVLSDGTNTDATYSTQKGLYERVGNVVIIQGQVVLTSLGTLAGNLQITGLPFVAASQSGQYGVLLIGIGDNLAITANQSVGGIVNNNTSEIVLYLWDAATGMTRFQAAEMSADGNLIFNAIYRVP